MWVVCGVHWLRRPLESPDEYPSPQTLARCHARATRAQTPTAGTPTRTRYPHALPPRLIGVTVWNFWRKVPNPLPCVWMFFVVLSGGGARGVRAAAKIAETSTRDKHTPEQAAPRPCVRQWQSSRVVGAGRERLGLVRDLRLGRRRRLAEVEEALLRRIRHLPTTRGFGSAYSEGAKHLEGAALLHPHLTHPTPPPPAADSCRH